MNFFLVLPIFVAKLSHQPRLPVQGPKKQIDSGQKVYDKHIYGHERSEPDSDKSWEQEGIPYPPVDAPDLQGICFWSLRAWKLRAYLEPVRGVTESQRGKNSCN